MSEFRFVILGAAHIAFKFVRAVSLIEGCTVTAVASKSLERAEKFANTHNLPRYYDSYEEMLIQEKPDAAYIAVTPHDHFRLSMLCVKHHVPVLCEKSMFLNSADAITLFDTAKKEKTFTMEALWTRFLPPILKAREWLRDGRIGAPVLSEMGVGYAAPSDPEGRWFNPKLGGGTAGDVVCYAYEVPSFILERPVQEAKAIAVKGETGVDVTSVVILKYAGGVPGIIKCSFLANPDEMLTIYGTKGRIVVPMAHMCREAYLYNENKEEVEHFVDQTTKNGFTYEIEELIRCVQAGELESPVVPHEETIACSKVFDLIAENMNEG